MNTSISHNSSLCIPKTLSFSISGLIQSDLKYLFFSILMSGYIYIFSVIRDRPLVSFTISLIYLPIVQTFISLYTPQYLFLPRNEGRSSKKYCIHFT